MANSSHLSGTSMILRMVSLYSCLISRTRQTSQGWMTHCVMRHYLISRDLLTPADL